MLNSNILFSKIHNSPKTLLICHRKPDGDTFGAAGALAFYINGIDGLKAKIFCVDLLCANLNYLAINEFIINPSELQLNEYSLIIILDCGDWKQTGIPDQLQALKNKICIINIDHHTTNVGYGDLNFVEPTTSATAEVIYKLFKAEQIPLTREITNCLLTGVLTDTTYFSNGGTTKQAVAAAAELLSKGANMKQIIQNTWRNHSPESLKIWGKVLSELHFNAKHKIATAVIPKEYQIEQMEIFEGLANFLSNLQEADIIMVIKEDADNKIRFSLRTTKNNISVAEIARRFGGGGHDKAAGFTLDGHLEKTDKGWKII